MMMKNKISTLSNWYSWLADPNNNELFNRHTKVFSSTPKSDKKVKNSKDLVRFLNLQRI